MEEKKYKEKMLEFLMELSKPKKYEVGYADGNRIVKDGLTILGMDASDILGFAKPENERSIRRLRGTQAWFKHMYNNGWTYVANFELEGLPHNGYVIMERELTNLTLNAIKEELDVLLRDDEGSKYIHVPNPEKLRGDDVSLADTTFLHQNIPIVSKDIPKPVMAVREAYLKELKKPKEGFDKEVEAFMIEAQAEIPDIEDIFETETGKKAIWQGKETKAFTKWKEEMMRI